MAKAIHTMIRVADLDKSIAFYDKAFDLKVAERFDFDGFALVYLRNAENDFEVELTWNEGQAEPYTTAAATVTLPFAWTTAPASTSASLRPG